MLLISQAIDLVVRELDFSELNGKTVFLDVQYLDGTVDRGYLVSTLRQHLLAHGALLQEDRDRATYVVEPRAGAVGTDKSSLLVGTPALNLPGVIPGVPTAIPEIALIKRTDQKGVAKIAVFAYNRKTGRALWQSGPMEAMSSLKDTWFFGAGPYSRGTIRAEGEFAGEAIPSFPDTFRVFPDYHAPEEKQTAPAFLPGEPEGLPEANSVKSFGSGLFGFDRPLFPFVVKPTTTSNGKPTKPSDATGPKVFAEDTPTVEK